MRKAFIVVGALLIISGVIGGVFALKHSTKQGDDMQPDQPLTKLESTDLVVGTGAEATSGKTVSVHYTGTLSNGQKFDSSLDRGQPFSFQLGAGGVIKGWDEGVVGMKVGGKRKLIIPPSLGYGDQAAGSIPPGSTLIFEIELLSVE
jgi:peptidylprolyl isomerase